MARDRYDDGRRTEVDEIIFTPDNESVRSILSVRRTLRKIEYKQGCLSCSRSTASTTLTSRDCILSDYTVALTAAMEPVARWAYDKQAVSVCQRLRMRHPPSMPSVVLEVPARP